MTTPASQPAGGLDDHAEHELRRYRRRAWALLLGGLALFVAFTVAAVVVEGRADDLERTGARTPGVVTDVRALGEDGSIVVELTWQGRPRREVIHLGADSRAYRNGDRVTALVDRRDPGHVSVRGETNQSPLTVWPMVVSAVGSGGMLITAVWALARGRRQRRHLRGTSWRRVPCQYVEIPSGNSVRPLLLLAESDGSRPILTLTSLARWRLAKTGLREASETDVSGDPSGYVVVRASREAPLVSARAPMTSRAARRWRRFFEKPPGSGGA